ncbi:MAG: type IX secretion system sortase PorU [Flavobacteriales bacterium]|nr:type IX secretion system sortase PorU [Flavobacteriales bacterium]MCB9362970.1 type IX secretion system sortase PorU [Flavobacteriales bacterium]
MRFFKLLLIMLLPVLGWSGNKIIEGKIDWQNNIENNILNGEKRSFFSFKSAKYDEKKDFLAFYSHRVKLNNEKIVSVSIVDLEYENISSNEVENIAGVSFISSTIDLQFYNATQRKQNYGVINFTPIITSSGGYQRITSYKINIVTESVSPSFSNLTSKTFVPNSVLSSGEWFKIGVIDNGVYQLSYSFLRDIGVDIDNIDPQSIKIYGNGGKMLPELNSDFRYDDLQQNAIEVKGELDGKFDVEDYVLFYGQSPHSWVYDQSSQLFTHELNRFSDTTFYFITTSNTGESAKRISTQSSLTTPNQTVTSFNDYAYYERDLYNLIKSGRDWYGDAFDVKTSYDYVFNFPNIDLSSLANVKVSGAGRSFSASNLTISVGNSSFNLTFNAVGEEYSAPHASASSGSIFFSPNSGLLNVNVTYNKPSSISVAWMDEIELNVRRNLVMAGNQLFFRDVTSVGVGNISQFNLSNANNVAKIWDITDPLNVKEQMHSSGNIASFNIATSELKQFVAFNNVYNTQVFNKGAIDNQNLHGLTAKDMIIVSHPLFLSQAEQIANFHREEGITVLIVTPNQIYNEFSSGSQDIVAIRDFLRMFYERATNVNETPKYLLLFGDGSYDNKNRVADNTNFIPTYQSINSLSPTNSLVSDDYFGLLDPTEGKWTSVSEHVDVGIGRFPVKSIEEANIVVNKVLNYNTSTTMKDWRNRITFIGDVSGNSDTWEGNIHMSQSNQLAGMVETNYPDYNEDKIFFDAFKKISTPGGSRYPEVNERIIKSFEEGALIINYTGHGGETGLAHERVLTVNDINGIYNPTNLPLMVTATCEFSRFDDPKRTSAGELVLLNEGGGVALLTTVRLVLSGPNFTLNKTFYEKVFEKVNNEMPRIGDVFMEVKNINAGDANNRNFTLLGDPALRLAYPIHDVATTEFNGSVITSSVDTVRALDKVTIKGEVQDENGQKLTNFNGVIYPTVFDKKKQITTLANDGGTPFIFDLQTNKLFKGKVSVINGDFSFSFVVPKDIAYNYGQGKISYYAENQIEDANGAFSNFYIGGTSQNIEADNDGPEIELYMNDKTFVFGGMTDENPKMLAYVSDIHGINMVGNGIGHDIIAVLDDKTDEAFILNDYYEADLNSYQKGVIKFPFQDLEEGRHKLTLKVWDVYNNSREVTTEFVVQKAKDIVIDRVYNYPNPFTTHTEFWFEHNQANKQMYAQIQIFTVSGKLVKTLEKNITNEGFRSTSITWDGLDEYGDRLAKGVYVYRLKVRAENLSMADKYEKLVIL